MRNRELEQFVLADFDRRIDQNVVVQSLENARLAGVGRLQAGCHSPTLGRHDLDGHRVLALFLVVDEHGRAGEEGVACVDVVGAQAQLVGPQLIGETQSLDTAGFDPPGRLGGLLDLEVLPLGVLAA